MQKINLQLMNNETVVSERESMQQTYLAYHHHYHSADFYRVTVKKFPVYLVVQLDVAISPAIIYVTQQHWDYQIPSNNEREWPYPDAAFAGRQHYAVVRYATNAEITGYRDLAMNSYDQHNSSAAFPHASANAETRNEQVFFAKNAIDGVIANDQHGNYPFESWGIDQRDDAELQLNFGRQVQVDRVGITLRADYPHDSFWEKVTIEFSDGSQLVQPLIKTAATQYFNFTAKKISWLKLTNLQKASDSAVFPALTNLAVWGNE